MNSGTVLTGNACYAGQGVEGLSAAVGPLSSLWVLVLSPGICFLVVVCPAHDGPAVHPLTESPSPVSWPNITSNFPHIVSHGQ